MQKNIFSSILASNLAPFETLWDHLGAILGPLEAILGPLGAILGPLCAIWDFLGTSWDLLEAILAPLEPSWSLLVHLGASGEAPLRTIWVPFWSFWIHFWMMLVPFWNRFWRFQNHSWKHVCFVFSWVGDAPPFGGLPGRLRYPLERSKRHTETPEVFMMAPEVAKFTFWHLLVLQCPNFIHRVFSLVLWDLLFIWKTKDVSTPYKCWRLILKTL